MHSEIESSHAATFLAMYEVFATVHKHCILSNPHQSRHCAQEASNLVRQHQVHDVGGIQVTVRRCYHQACANSKRGEHLQNVCIKVDSVREHDDVLVTCIL